MSAKTSLSFQEIAALFRSDPKQARRSIFALFHNKRPLFSKRNPAHAELLAEHLGKLFYTQIATQDIPILRLVHTLTSSSKKELTMIALVILGEYGRNHPYLALPYLQKSFAENNRTLQHITLLAFKRIASKHPHATYNTLLRLVLNRNKQVRTFICQAVLMYAQQKTFAHSPENILRITHWFMRDSDLPIKRTLGKTLTTVSKKHPEDVFAFFKKELAQGNLHTYWIIYRASNVLVKNKKFKARILELLNVTTYHAPRR